MRHPPTGARPDQHGQQPGEDPTMPPAKHIIAKNTRRCEQHLHGFSFIDTV
jgi:hypothetical protein